MLVPNSTDCPLYGPCSDWRVSLAHESSIYIWHKITHFRSPGRNCPVFKVLSQFSLLFCIFPHTCITSQDTNAAGFTADSKDTVFHNLGLRQQQFSQWDRAVSHNCHYTGQFCLSIHRRDSFHFCEITWKEEINWVILCNKSVSKQARAYLFSLLNRRL
jgi:hypothetical protein